MDYRSVPTTCPYCGVGCGLLLEVLDGKIIGTLPLKTAPTNEGSLCIKGWKVHEFVQHRDRLTKPLIRREKSFQEVPWESALNDAATQLKKLKDTYGPESVAFVGSARCVNEETYLYQKFVRAVFGHNHIDHCARL
jgi:predicted molibdopterin-dependent oxidoreductase YjgC